MKFLKIKKGKKLSIKEKYNLQLNLNDRPGSVSDYLRSNQVIKELDKSTILINFLFIWIVLF